MSFPVIGPWVDMAIIVLVYAFLTKIVQHYTMDLKKYFSLKKKSKDLNKEVKQLAKEQKHDEVSKKQKEMMKLIGPQFKLSQKSMLVMMVLALPLLYFIKEFYDKLTYDFGLFSVSGLWAYIILGVIISMIVSTVYDKKMMKKYVGESEK